MLWSLVSCLLAGVPFFSVVDQVQEKQGKSQESRIPEILIELDFIYGSCISLVEKSLSDVPVFVICRLGLIWLMPKFEKLEKFHKTEHENAMLN